MNSPRSDPEPLAALQRVVVSDARPLISLARLDLMSLLPQQFSEIQMPQQVVEECTARSDRPDVARIPAALASGWLVPCDAAPIDEKSLGWGERAAIARALEIDAGLLVDDMEARLYAAARGIAVTGTLGVLVRARRAGRVPAITPLIAQLRASGQRFAAAELAQAIAAAGEAGI